ncbi:MAG: hypothetical protein KDE27_03755 [Planctomycetes bacterium]|nr:hypothetical protein [Planctomycetota bacterium]
MSRAESVLPCLLAAALAAQDGPGDRGDVVDFERAAAGVQRLLAAEDPVAVARGARLAQRLGLTAVVPELRRSLRAWSSPPDREPWHVRYYLLDALIQLGAELPGEELAPQLGGELEPLALILAARSPAAHRTLLWTVLQRHWLGGDPVVRLAAGNLLAATRAPGFAAWLLARLPLRLEVTVRDFDPDVITFDSGGVGGAYGVRTATLPARYPPLPRYELTWQGAAFATLLAPGPQPVWFRRVDDGGRWFTIERSRPTPVAPGPAVHAWLLAMADVDERRLGLPLRRFELVHFRDPGSCRERVAGWRAELEAAFAGLVRRLEVRGALGPVEAAAIVCPLRIELLDERRDRALPLPTFSTVR